VVAILHGKFGVGDAWAIVPGKILTAPAPPLLECAQNDFATRAYSIDIACYLGNGRCDEALDRCLENPLSAAILRPS